MKKIYYAFIVHSRDRNDIYRKFPALKHFPTFFVDYITKTIKPLFVSNISGLIDRDGNEKKGAIIGIPMTARQMLEDREKALYKIIQSVKMAKKSGAKIIALGAMTASLSKSGNDVVDRIKDVVITNGRTYTSINITSYVDYCIRFFNFDRNTIKIAIVGAAGGIGKGVLSLLIEKGIKNFTLIDLERKLENIKEHIITSHNDKINNLCIETDHRLSAIKGSRIIIAATSSPEIVIKSEDVDSGTIIINDAQPSDIDPNILTNRDDVLVIEGGVVRTDNINCHFDLGLHHKNDIYSCLAEAVLLSYVNNIGSHYIELNANNQQLLKQLSSDMNFRIAGFQNSQGYVSEDFISKFSLKNFV